MRKIYIVTGTRRRIRLPLLARDRVLCVSNERNEWAVRKGVIQHSQGRPPSFADQEKNKNTTLASLRFNNGNMKQCLPIVSREDKESGKEANFYFRGLTPFLSITKLPTSPIIPSIKE